MKELKIGSIVLAAALVTFGTGGPAFAFHSGGVAECMGCHALHNAKSASSLLVGTDVSSTCLTCHHSAIAGNEYVSTDESAMPAGTPPGNRTPGGDFGWLKKTYTWNPGDGAKTEAGDRHGHNIVSIDFSYAADTTNLIAPGGTMDATQLSCNSCHDQHGKLRRLSGGTFATSGAPIIGSGSYNTSPDPVAGQAVGAYRLLRGGTTAASEAGSGGVTFAAGVVFNAVAPSTFNRSEAVTPTRVAYGAGNSTWCAACHPDMHSATSSKMTHPVNQGLGPTVTANYNAYKGSGDATGTQASSYDSIVPFQTGNTSDYAVLKPLAVNDGSVSTGPETSDRVMCLSCHRAHATGWESLLRWDNGIELIVVEGQWPGTNAAGSVASLPVWAKGRSVAERSMAYHDKPATNYATYQRPLCNKCHSKD